MELNLAGGLVEHCFKHGTKRFNAAKKKKILFQMTQVVMTTLHQSYSTAEVSCDM